MYRRICSGKVWNARNMGYWLLVGLLLLLQLMLLLLLFLMLLLPLVVLVLLLVVLGQHGGDPRTRMFLPVMISSMIGMVPKEVVVEHL